MFAARMPMAHRIRSCTGSAMMPSGCAATSVLEARQQVVVVVPVLLGRQESEPRDRECGHGGLADARAERQGLLGGDAQGDVVPPRPVPEASR